MIHVHHAQKKIPISSQRIKKVVRTVLAHFKIEKDRGLNIFFLSDQEMAKLHHAHLGKASATDVLAFGMQEGGTFPGEKNLIGDIAISTETALRHAARFHKPIDEEISLYVIHGILHLLGYRDQRQKDRAKMRRKEKELLATCQNGVASRKA